MTRLSGTALVVLLLAGAGLVSAQDYPHAYPWDGAEQLFAPAGQARQLAP